jgi:hypothetical protein
MARAIESEDSSEGRLCNPSIQVLDGTFDHRHDAIELSKQKEVGDKESNSKGRQKDQGPMPVSMLKSDE